MYSFYVESDRTSNLFGCYQITVSERPFKFWAILSAKKMMKNNPKSFHAYVRRTSDGRIVWEKYKNQD